MKTYEANEELIKILEKNNFFETSSKIDIKKGKKKFKLSRFAQKSIYFDYINIIVFDGIHGLDDKLIINENELKILLLYFRLKSQDSIEITHDQQFKFKSSINNFEYLKKELADLKRLNLKKARVSKLERIMRVYNQIEL